MLKAPYRPIQERERKKKKKTNLFIFCVQCLLHLSVFVHKEEVHENSDLHFMTNSIDIIHLTIEVRLVLENEQKWNCLAFVALITKFYLKRERTLQITTLSRYCKRRRVCQCDCVEYTKRAFNNFSFGIG